MRIGRQHRQRIRWRDEAALANDQVAIAVAVRCRAEVRGVGSHHQLVKFVRVDQVGIGVMPAEIFERRAVSHCAHRKPQPAFEHFGGVRPGHRVHSVERHREPACHCGADRGEIEQRFHQVGVVGDRVDDRNRHGANGASADPVEIDVGRCNGVPNIYHLSSRKYCLGHGFGRGAAVGGVVLDPEVVVGSAGVVAG